MNRRDRLSDLVETLTRSGQGLAALLADPKVLARLSEREIDHMAAALEASLRAFSCMEFVAGIGPELADVPRIRTRAAADLTVH